MNRISDIFFTVIFLPFIIFLFILISVVIFFTFNGPILFWSKRNGKNNKIFLMPKFRTMNINSPNVATHLLVNPEKHLTKIGKILRKFSLDEIPQFYSVLKGDMAIIGPRPALYNQYDLITLRGKYKLNKILPGLTGWAQINGRDELSIDEKVKLEIYYMSNKSLFFDLRIIFLTIFKLFLKKGISH